MTGREPQPVMCSTNRCPNSGPDHLRPGSTECNPDALTVFGWCGLCWTTGRVPQAWLDALDPTAYGGAA